MSSLKKKAQVIMLPTSNATIGTIMKYTKYSPLHDAVIDKKVGQLVLNKNTNVTKTNEYWGAQALHIVDDSEIKEGDWCLAVLTNTLFQVKEIDSSTREIYYLQFGILCPKRNAKKVIASTDKSLDLPSPSEQFIQKYVELYNKGNVITDVMIEWEEAEEYDIVYNKEKYFPRIKIDSKNQVTITRCKDSYSKEEVTELFEKFVDQKYPLLYPFLKENL